MAPSCQKKSNPNQFYGPQKNPLWPHAGIRFVCHSERCEARSLRPDVSYRGEESLFLLRRPTSTKNSPAPNFSKPGESPSVSAVIPSPPKADEGSRAAVHSSPQSPSASLCASAVKCLPGRISNQGTLRLITTPPQQSTSQSARPPGSPTPSTTRHNSARCRNQARSQVPPVRFIQISNASVYNLNRQEGAVRIKEKRASHDPRVPHTSVLRVGVLTLVV
jgi:hypothetical protein